MLSVSAVVAGMVAELCGEADARARWLSSVEGGRSGSGGGDVID